MIDLKELFEQFNPMNYGDSWVIEQIIEFVKKYWVYVVGGVIIIGAVIIKGIFG